ncbi:MAG: hypothetical protein KJ955_02380 [Nanoarchaeota archaeon]|nr:hypothetical protein [Nanoarchaeota archaeon]
MAKAGEAYGFLQYNGRIEDLLEQIPEIRTTARTPPELSLQVIEGAGNLDTAGDPGLANVVRIAQGAGLNYVLKASLPNADNRKVAGLLGNINDDLYASRLYNNGRPFCAEIAYHNGVEYDDYVD